MDGRYAEFGVVVLSVHLDSVSPVLQLFVLCSVLRRKYFCFLSFYCLLFKTCGGDDDAVDDNEYFIDIIEGQRNLAHHLCQPFIFSIVIFV